MTSLSRRSWLTLTACACASVSDALSADAFAADEVPPGYTSPFHVPESGKAPGMRVRQTTVASLAPRSWIIVFADGDEVMSGLTDWVRREKKPARTFPPSGHSPPQSLPGSTRTNARIAISR